MTIEIVKNVFELQQSIARRRMEPTNSAATVGIVPTMGAIHQAHTNLVHSAKINSDIVVSTIFVNPKQFGENEDFDDYPRSEKEDIEKLEKAGSNIIYIPSTEIMYPEDFDLNINVPKLSSILCGKHRENHFQGVATVVTKLLIQSNADFAFFGEKDYQQLLIIKNLVKDLDINCKIISIPIVRDQDGLALSSRNIYLKNEKKIIANNLYKILTQAAKDIANGDGTDQVISNAKKDILISGFNKIDYLEIREERQLGEIKDYNKIKARLFVAAYIDNIRLIDNIIVE